MKLLSVYTKNLFAESPIDKSQKIITGPDGTIVLEAVLPDTVVLRSALLGFGSEVEVMEPRQLREELLCEAEKLVKNYKHG